MDGELKKRQTPYLAKKVTKQIFETVTTTENGNVGPTLVVEQFEPKPVANESYQKAGLFSKMKINLEDAEKSNRRPQRVKSFTLKKGAKLTA